jgi:hypothetical protein
MEFVITVALIIGLNELREWRFAQRMKKLEDEVRQSREFFDATCEELTHDLGAKLDGTHAFVEKAATQLEAMNRAIDAHGLRVNFKSAEELPEADFIGGF